MDATVAVAWLHPALMTLAIAGAAWVLGLGLRLRKARVRATARPKAWWRQHVRLAKIALAMGAGGVLLGPLAWWLRGEPLLSSLHGRVGLVTVALATTAFLAGRRLETGRGRPVNLHAAAGIATVVAAVVALLTGLELLP